MNETLVENRIVTEDIHYDEISASIQGRPTINVSGICYDNSCAWITYVVGENYIQGARVVGRSLLKSKSRFKLIVYVPLSTFASVEHYQDENVIFVARDTESLGTETSASYASERFALAINKVVLWTFLEYDKVCWLDSDLLILQNIDDVFDVELPPASVPALAGARGCSCNALGNPKLLTLPHKCPFLHVDKIYINAGLFVTRPSLAVYHDLLTISYDYPFAEQDAYNVYFQEKGRVIQLDSKYNYMNNLPISHPEVPIRHSNSRLAKYKCISVFHFGYGKPWDHNVLNLNQDMYDRWTSLLKEL